MVVGKEPYANWKTKDMLKDILHNKYSSIAAIPELNISNVFKIFINVSIALLIVSL